MSASETPADWIASRDALAAWLAAQAATAPLGIDTEFMRRNTFHPQLALLQLGWNGRYALVDPLAFAIGDGLQPRLGASTATVVMHSAGEDLETLAPLLPDGPGRLFDTQLAAAFAGMGAGLSYRALVAELAGVELDKGETRSDWLQRPLTASQRRYATLDVVYLETLHAQLAERLAARGRTAWFEEDCARLKQRASHRDGDPQPQRTLHGAAEWPIERQALLRRLLRWRDASARTLDVPRPWLVEDALALDLTHTPPADLAALESRARGQRALRRAQREQLFELLVRPLEADEIATTLPIFGHPHGATKQALTRMKQAVDQRAATLDLPAGLLCARKSLEEFVMTRAWPEALEGWRREELHATLQPLLPD